MTDTKPTYYELLRHPNWQRKRLEVLKRADFTCEECGSKDNTLNVHHTYYEKGKAPWEYSSGMLRCLCDGCHKTAQSQMTTAAQVIGFLGIEMTNRLFGFALGLLAEQDMSSPVDVSADLVEGVAKVWDISPLDVTNAIRDGCIDGNTLKAIRDAKKASL